MITTEQLDEWQKLCDAATPGPWYWDPIDECLRSEIEDSAVWESCGRLIDIEKNGKLIATARTAMPLLIEEVKRLRNSDENNAR